MQTADDTLVTAVGPARHAPPALGRYQLMRRLGSGAFGVVWLARDEQLDRLVAVKRIELHDEHIGARAEREALAAARLQHPGIVALYESGRDDDAMYLVSELVRGRTLADLLDDGALSDRDVLRIGVALCGALAHAHARGVIHRDVKPANVMIPDSPADEAGIAKLTDLGVASIAGDDALTRTGDVVGTLAYMAPEQADGHEAGGATDLYALGLVLYEALSGVNPVRAGGAAATVRRVGTRLPPLGRMRRDVPHSACTGIDRAVLPRPEDRGGLDDLREALEDALAGAARTPGPVTPRTHAPRLPGARDVTRTARPAPRGNAPGAGGIARRLAGGLVAAALVAAVVDAAPIVSAPSAVPVAAAAAGVAVALLPRAGVLMAFTALACWLVAAGIPGGAVLLAAVLIPAVLLLPRDGALWSAPAGAPLLGLVGLALAWPALAGLARGPVRRAALGALGVWWLLLAEALTPGRLLLGDVPGSAAASSWEESATRAVTDVLAPIVTSGAPLLALLWAAAAALLPVLVRGRGLALDLIGATFWAAGLAAGSAALIASLPWPGAAPEPRGLVIGAIAAAVAALVGAAARAPAPVRALSP